MIKHKKKPCKGSTAETRGMGCSVPTYHRVLGLGKMCGCYNEYLNTTESGKIRLAKLDIRKSVGSGLRKTTPIKKKSSNPLPRLLQMTVDVCHQFIKLRDYGRPCVSCGAIWDESFQACHYFKAELYSTLKFNELNIHGGCVDCNIHLDGNLDEYGKRIGDRIGTYNLAILNDLAKLDKQVNHKWDRIQLEELYQKYNRKIKHLKTQKNVCGTK